jgi:EAL domain-containing protein (putative c-di-GMP-specific phosphodiesterase class I)
VSTKRGAIHITKALANESLEVWYQPIVTDNGSKVDTFEALLRWRHPSHGWIPSQNIVDTAAIIGLAETLLRFIIRDVIVMAVMLKSIDREDIRIAVNISPRELAQIPVDELILTKLEKMGVAPSVLELEITEDAAVNPGFISSRLARLARSGVRIAIDDFGVGYSSLASLQQIRADRVKIDKTFVTGTTLGSADRSLIDAVLRVSEAYGFDVVAEGVETESDYLTMRKLGCRLMQGYLFAKPMPKDKAVAWLNEKDGSRHKSS